MPDTPSPSHPHRAERGSRRAQAGSPVTRTRWGDSISLCLQGSRGHVSENVSECGTEQFLTFPHMTKNEVGRTPRIARESRGIGLSGLVLAWFCLVGTPGFEPGVFRDFPKEFGHVSENVSEEMPMGATKVTCGRHALTRMGRAGIRAQSKISSQAPPFRTIHDHASQREMSTPQCFRPSVELVSRFLSFSRFSICLSILPRSSRSSVAPTPVWSAATFSSATFLASL